MTFLYAQHTFHSAPSYLKQEIQNIKVLLDMVFFMLDNKTNKWKENMEIEKY